MTAEKHKAHKEICDECGYFKVSTAPVFGITHTKVCMNDRSDHYGHVLYLSHPACIKLRDKYEMRRKK